MTTFEQALEALRARVPAPHHPPRVRLPEPKNPTLERWRELMATGVPAGSKNREVAALRAELLARGDWREVYRCRT